MPQRAADALVAVAAIGVSLSFLVLSEEADRRVPDAVGSLLLVLAGMPLVVRRRWPSAALAVTTATAVGYLTLAYPGGPVTVPVLVAVYSAAAWGRRASALAVVGFFVGVGSAHRLVVQQEPIVTIAFQALLPVFAWLLGELVCSQRALRFAADERLRQAAQEGEREAARRVEQERVRIARELHDVMAHTVSSMTVQAGVADDVLDDRPDEARAALAAIRRAGREAMAELRATLNLLRSDDGGEPLPPAPALAELDTLVERVIRDGLAVERVTAGHPRALSAAVELTGYRIVQEALTNVVRHAGARTAVVSLAYEPAALVVEVTDDGRDRGAGPIQPGFGLLGMRERAEAVGGRLEAGRTDDGFRVWARLPAGHDGR